MLLFGDKIWVMLEVIINKIEGLHVGFLRKLTGMKARRLGGETWTKEGPDRVLQVAVTKQLRGCIYKRQEIVAKWVALRPIFDFCAKWMRYEGGGGLQEPWWWQEAAEQQLGPMLKNFLVAAGQRRKR